LGSDWVREAGNVDFILTNTFLWGNGFDSLNSIENARLTGGVGNNVLDTSSFTGNVILDGDKGQDQLLGANGNDTLVGGAGNDVLTGGLGQDRFTFDVNAPFTTTTMGLDRITDFTIGLDKIVLDKTTFTALAGFSLTGQFASVTTDVAATTSSALIVYNRANGNLFYNQNGSLAGLGTGGEFATLTSIPNLSATDFLVVA
jgi:Ca2+-binding RTX toxin-like protein